MYVDESGDIGALPASPTRYFVLTGIVLHSMRWQSVLDDLLRFRRRMNSHYGLRLREEIHASHFINKPGPLVRIKRHDRLNILRAVVLELSTYQDLSVINVVVDKLGKPPTFDVFETAWRTLIQRFENTLRHKNFPGPAVGNDPGLILPDRGYEKQLRDLTRRMRHYNPVPSKTGAGYLHLPMSHVIEDPKTTDSADSYFIQAADVLAYMLFQHLSPNKYMRKNGGHNYFPRLKPILCLVAGPGPLGVVFR